MAAGLDFTVASASLGALLRISEKSLGGMPEVELLGVEVDLSPRHLSLSLRNLPLPGADLLASSAVGALLGTWGVASSLDVLGVGGTLASIVSQAVTQMIATEFLPLQLERTHEFLASLAHAHQVTDRPRASGSRRRCAVV
mmetsp:Transcript_23972/g.77354  ORF Transcript_23972/g.77354 Transcript_23972/m.77354 type:complete len:141 (+) Transcript_23972:765-1187(+)